MHGAEAGAATSASSSGLDLARLGALTNYRSKLTDNAALTSTYRVHSPTDWEVFDGKLQPLDVNVRGSEYELIPHVSNLELTYKWERTGPAQSYDQSPYPSYARGFAALTHATGVKVVRGKQCRQPGIAGHLWHFAAKAKGAVYPPVSPTDPGGSSATTRVRAAAGHPRATPPPSRRVYSGR